jgi:hypothetical protein
MRERKRLRGDKWSVSFAKKKKSSETPLDSCACSSANPFIFCPTMSAFTQLTWNDHDDKGELGSRIKTNLGASSKQKRAQVKCSTRTIRRHEFQVVSNSTLAGLDKELLRDGGHAGELCRVLHPLGVCVRAEDADLAILAAEGLDSFETLLLCKKV